MVHALGHWRGLRTGDRAPAWVRCVRCTWSGRSRSGRVEARHASSSSEEGLRIRPRFDAMTRPERPSHHLRICCPRTDTVCEVRVGSGARQLGGCTVALMCRHMHYSPQKGFRHG
jgi:hypothetical protein